MYRFTSRDIVTVRESTQDNLQEDGFKGLQDSVLNLSHQNLNNDSIQLLCKQLENNTYVKSLDLSFNNFDDQGARYLADLLAKNKTLTDLNLNGNWIRDLGSNALRKGLEQNHSIKQLRFDRHLALEDDKDVIDQYLMRNAYGH
jgi:Ran GTPase-activating protein (RanGAP) involved in mRNA processing and transport